MIEALIAGVCAAGVIVLSSGVYRMRRRTATSRRVAAVVADTPLHGRIAQMPSIGPARVDWRLQLYGGAGHSFTNPAADSRGMKGFFYHEATDRRSWNAMIELFNETLK